MGTKCKGRWRGPLGRGLQETWFVGPCPSSAPDWWGNPEALGWGPHPRARPRLLPRDDASRGLCRAAPWAADGAGNPQGTRPSRLLPSPQPGPIGWRGGEGAGLRGDLPDPCPSGTAAARLGKRAGLGRCSRIRTAPPPRRRTRASPGCLAGSVKAAKQAKSHLHPAPIAPRPLGRPINSTEPGSGAGGCSAPGSAPQMGARQPWLLLAGLWVAALLPPGRCRPPSPGPLQALPASGGAPLQDAEQEQGHYLQQLFGLYGQSGTLSFDGLTRLLRSLGLGRVQVVQMEHEALGHGHVSHLDVLEVQGQQHRHRHSALEHLGQQPPGPGPEGQRENSTARPGSPERMQPPQGAPAPTGPAASRGTRPPLDVAGPSTTCAPGHPGGSRDPDAPPLSLLERVLALEHSVADHLHEDCLNVTQLLVNFGLNSVSTITPEQFTLLCPALLYQIDSRVCIRHDDHLAPEPLGGALWPGLGWGFLAVTLISLPSVLAILLVPCLGRRPASLLLAFLVALAVGTLCGDALLHLWPHAQGRHHQTQLEQQDSVLKGLSVLGGIYLLFLVEHVLGTLKRSRSRRRRSPGSPSLAADGSRGLTLRALAPSQEAESQSLTTLGPGSNSPGHAEEGGRRPAPHVDGQTEEQCHHGHSHGLGAGIADTAWMVILGDGIHNLTDGLAIGAAFSDGVSSGLSTTVAVFCHELPHELGDVAALLQAGVPIRTVLLSNLLSACLAYLGVAVGTVVSQATAQVTPWIFSSTAGIFLYVALVDMLPEMLRPSSSRSRQGPVTYFALQNLGFLVGAAVMLCIALFEDELSFHVAL
ncbi:zinc transporter ZIP5 isoform X2 [Pelodiscus sinensis]|uniref:zinc transporter ZIP5 isoform X2 n=1 Tax=Pelodiscus sinensis TaxID=13735 RepID=UPI003F6A7B46